MVHKKWDKVMLQNPAGSAHRAQPSSASAVNGQSRKEENLTGNLEPACELMVKFKIGFTRNTVPLKVNHHDRSRRIC